MPAFVETDCSGRIQYLGILNLFGFVFFGASALEYFLTDWPLLSLISIVTGPVASFDKEIINHRAVWRILAGRFVRRQRRVGVQIVAHA